MDSSHWEKVGRATWRYFQRGPEAWTTTLVVCRCTGPEQFVVYINGYEVATLPSWDDVLTMTPILIGIHKSQKAPS